MTRRITFHADTGQIDIIGKIEPQDYINAGVGYIAGALLIIARHAGWEEAEQQGADACAAIGKYLDQAKGRHQ